MPKVSIESLLKAGVHFGHLTRRWNPKMKPYIFMEKNGIHIVDLQKTAKNLERASKAIKEIAMNGDLILFVGTKNQAKEAVKAEATRCEMHYMCERWLGGTMTNFSTIKKSVRHLENLEKMLVDGTAEKFTKKERLQMDREIEKMKKFFSGIQNMKRLPGALFVVDIKKEEIAVKEAKKLNIPVFAIVDTNCDPELVDYPIPGNDDSTKSVSLICRAIADSIIEGRESIKAKEEAAAAEAEKREEKKPEKKVVKKVEKKVEKKAENK